MNKFKISVLITMMITVGVSFAYSQDDGFDITRLKQIKTYKSTQLENGLTLIQLNSTDTINCFIRAYSNLPEYTSKNFRSVLEIQNELNKMQDFELPSGWTENKLNENQIVLKNDEFGFYAKCPNTNLENAFVLFSDLFQKITVNKTSFEQSKLNILAKSDSLEKLPNDKIDKITKSIIYGKDHPILKHFSPNDINSVTFENYQEFKEKFYKPNNSYLVVIGSISVDSIKNLCSKSLSIWKKKEVPSSNYKLIPIDEPKIVFFDTIPEGKTIIKILFPFALHPFSFDAEKAELLSLVFQDVISTKLIQNKKIASSISAKFESDKITGNYQLQVQLSKDSILQTIETIVETISDFKAGNFPEEKLILAKKQIISDFKKHKTTDDFISWLIINTELNNLSKEFYPDFIEEIEKTDNQGMRTFTAKYLNYGTALFQIPGKWYVSLNDFIKLCQNFRIELYDLDGNIKKIIPRGFNGFSVIDNYVSAIGGEQTIKKIKEVHIKYGAIYEIQNQEQFFVDGIMIHKAEDKYFSENHMIRQKRDTLLLLQEKFNGTVGTDSTMQGFRMLQGQELELLKYKSPFVPEMKYKSWLYSANLVKADTLEGNYVWVVNIENPVKQQIVDYYDVDKGIRYKREIKDQQYLNQRVILYSKYQKIKDDEILYPYLKIINGPETTIRMLIREVDYNSKSDKKLFDIN
jgi:predicted Zn-dependent peptidase